VMMNLGMRILRKSLFEKVFVFFNMQSPLDELHKVEFFF